MRAPQRKRVNVERNPARLNVVASPTSVPVGARLDTNAGSELQGIADGLGELIPVFDKYVQMERETEKAKSIERARGAIGGMTFDEAKKEIEKGTMLPNESPWFRAAFNKSFGTMAGNAVAGEIAALLKATDYSNPGDFNKKVAEIVKKYGAGIAGDALRERGFNDVVNPARAKALGLFKQNLSKYERKIATRNHFQNLGSTLDRLVGEGKTEDEIRSAIEAHVRGGDTLGLTKDEVRANLKALAEAYATRKDKNASKVANALLNATITGKTTTDKRSAEEDAKTKPENKATVTKDDSTTPKLTEGRSTAGTKDPTGTEPKSVAEGRKVRPGIIGSAELGRFADDGTSWDRLIRGVRVGGKWTFPGNKPLTKMTVTEVINYSEAERKRGRLSTAAGAYQLLKANLRNAIKKGLVKATDKFTPYIQRKIIAAEIRGFRQGDKFIAGKISEDKFINNLAKHFASLPVATRIWNPAKDDNGNVIGWVNPGEPYHKGFKGNVRKAKKTLAEMRAAVREVKSSGSLVALIGPRLSPDESDSPTGETPDSSKSISYDYFRGKSGSVSDARKNAITPELLAKRGVRLSKHYSLRELNGGHGNRPINLRPMTLRGLDRMTDRFGAKVKIISGYRWHTGSLRHKHGTAIDIDTSSLSRADTLRLIKAAREAGATSVGIYGRDFKNNPSSIHVDWDGEKIRPTYGTIWAPGKVDGKTVFKRRFAPKWLVELWEGTKAGTALTAEEKATTERLVAVKPASGKPGDVNVRKIESEDLTREATTKRAATGELLGAPLVSSKPKPEEVVVSKPDGGADTLSTDPETADDASRIKELAKRNSRAATREEGLKILSELDDKAGRGEIDDSHIGELNSLVKSGVLTVAQARQLLKTSKAAKKRAAALKTANNGAEARAAFELNLVKDLFKRATNNTHFDDDEVYYYNDPSTGKRVEYEAGKMRDKVIEYARFQFKDDLAGYSAWLGKTGWTDEKLKKGVQSFFISLGRGGKVTRDTVDPAVKEAMTLLTSLWANNPRTAEKHAGSERNKDLLRAFVLFDRTGTDAYNVVSELANRGDLNRTAFNTDAREDLGKAVEEAVTADWFSSDWSKAVNSNDVKNNLDFMARAYMRLGLGAEDAVKAATERLTKSYVRVGKVIVPKTTSIPRYYEDASKLIMEKALPELRKAGIDPDEVSLAPIGADANTYTLVHFGNGYPRRLNIAIGPNGEKTLSTRGVDNIYRDRAGMYPVLPKTQLLGNVEKLANIPNFIDAKMFARINTELELNYNMAKVMEDTPVAKALRVQMAREYFKIALTKYNHPITALIAIANGPEVAALFTTLGNTPDFKKIMKNVAPDGPNPKPELHKTLKAIFDNIPEYARVGFKLSPSEEREFKIRNDESLRHPNLRR